MFIKSEKFVHQNLRVNILNIKGHRESQVYLEGAMAFLFRIVSKNFACPNCRTV